MPYFYQSLRISWINSNMGFVQCSQPRRPPKGLPLALCTITSFNVHKGHYAGPYERDPRFYVVLSSTSQPIFNLLPIGSDLLSICLYIFRINNCRDAMKLARQHFGIPLVLRPEDLASSELDELSAITYLSYFTKIGAPGYNSTLQKIQPLVKTTTVFNFTVMNFSYYY